eukprot:365255-Chlamydomonas_euryale.AAC.35
MSLAMNVGFLEPRALTEYLWRQRENVGDAATHAHMRRRMAPQPCEDLRTFHTLVLTTGLSGGRMHMAVQGKPCLSRMTQSRGMVSFKAFCDKWATSQCVAPAVTRAGATARLSLAPAVYRADNRSKVEKDEAEARAEDEAARSKHADAEREFRRQVLLHRKGIADTSTTADSTEPNEAAPTAPISHINFWSEDETRLAAEHPEVAVREGLLMDDWMTG